MEPQVSSPLGLFEQFLIIVFALTFLAGIAGGHPDMVLRHVFEIVARLLTTILSKLCALVSSAFRLAVGILFLFDCTKPLRRAAISF